MYKPENVAKTYKTRKGAENHVAREGNNLPEGVSLEVFEVDGQFAVTWTYAEDEPQAGDRDLLLAVIGTHRNGWMSHFATASTAVAKAIVNNNISVADIKTLPDTYVHPRSVQAAHRVIEDWKKRGVLPLEVDEEGVYLGVEAIVGLCFGLIGREVNPWYFGDDDSISDADLERVAQAGTMLTVKEAAQALLDADTYFHEHGYYSSPKTLVEEVQSLLPEGFTAEVNIDLGPAAFLISTGEQEDGYGVFLTFANGFNTEGWEAALDAAGTYYATPDGPGPDAPQSDVATWAAGLAKSYAGRGDQSRADWSDSLFSA